MLKKLAPIFLIILVGGLFFPLTGSAAGVYTACEEIKEDGTCEGPRAICYEGFVPCGKPVMVGTPGQVKLEKGKCTGGDMTAQDKPLHCQLCHFFVMIDGMIDYLLLNIVPYVAVLMLVIGGIIFYFSGAKPDLRARGKTLIKGVVIGLFLIYGAYMIVGIFLKVLGAAEVESVKEVFDHGVFSIKCLIELPK